MSKQNKAMLRRLYEEGFNQGKPEVGDEVIALGAVDHESPSGTTGPQAFKEAVAMFRTAFPDLKVTVDDMMADGDKVIGRATARGTHKGDFMGIAPTGKQVEVGFIDIIQFEGGKAVEHWGITDNLSMMQQLGVVPEMG